MTIRRPLLVLAAVPVLLATGQAQAAETRLARLERRP